MLNTDCVTAELRETDTMLDTDCGNAGMRDFGNSTCFKNVGCGSSTIAGLRKQHSLFANIHCETSDE